MIKVICASNRVIYPVNELQYQDLLLISLKKRH